MPAGEKPTVPLAATALALYAPVGEGTEPERGKVGRTSVAAPTSTAA